MKKKSLTKLSLHRETVHRLESSVLYTIAGGDTAGVACAPTWNGTCKSCTCPPCFVLTDNTCHTDCGCTTL
jgi:hypothetical protein